MENLKVNNLSKTVTKAIRSTKVANQRVQQALQGIAYSVFKHNNVSELTRLIKGSSFSRINASGELVLFKSGLAVSAYMNEVLPLHFDKESQQFKINSNKAKEWDWEKAETTLLATSFNEYAPVKAETVFDPDSIMSQILNKFKSILKDSQEHPDNYVSDERKETLETAKRFLRMDALEA